MERVVCMQQGVWRWSTITIEVCSLLALSHRDALACIDGLVQDCSNSIANALKLLQSCTEPLKNGSAYRWLSARLQ